MNPFIPLKSANVAIVDGRIDKEIENNLERLGLKVIKTIRCNEVHESIAYHPDIVIHPINHNTLAIAPNVFDYYEEKLSDMGINLIKGEKYLSSKYPEDIAYNVGRLRGIAIHNFKYTDEVLKFHLKKENIDFVNVNQGYTKCSLAIVGEDAAITADYPMYKKLISLGYKILLIESGHVLLKGQNYGFIGGTNGNLYNGKSIISGSLNEHPNKDEILKFFIENSTDLIFLSQKNLLDIGTIIALYCH